MNGGERIMKVCNSCNQKYDDKMVFCPKCRKELVDDRNHTCPKCKRLLDKGFEFCPYCVSQLVVNNETVRSSFETENHTIIINNIETEFEEGIKYYYGKGVRQNYTEAAKWFRKAAERGHAVAQNSLGEMYKSGKGVRHDNVEAAKWFRKAAEQGLADAQYSLGMLYFIGEGVEQSDVEALKWCRKAAEQGHSRANFDYKRILYANKCKEEREKSNKGCFITTAVCGSLGKQDNCDELMTMRRYRDKLKAEDKDMAILIQEYYRVAPLIVQKIDKSNEAKRIYNDLWTTSISKIYINIKQGKSIKAKLQYINMLEELCVRYNVPLASETANIIEKIKKI